MIFVHNYMEKHALLACGCCLATWTARYLVTWAAPQLHVDVAPRIAAKAHLATELHVPNA
jgi:hypothetical protein